MPVPGDPVTVDLSFLTAGHDFSSEFGEDFHSVLTPDPLFLVGGFSEDFSLDYETHVQETPYRTVPATRPDHRLWRRFAYQPAPQGLLLYKDDQAIVVVDDFATPGYLDSDDQIMGGMLWVAPYGCWQTDLLEAHGFQIVPATNLNAPPYIVDEQGEML